MKTSTDPENKEVDADEESAPADNVRYLCMKYNRHQQGNDIACQDPKLYCKFRPQCMIHFTEKRNRRKSQASEG